VLLSFNLVILVVKTAVGLCLGQNSTHLHHPLKVTQEGILKVTFTYRDSH
jgi:hypothetical protein